MFLTLVANGNIARTTEINVNILYLTLVWSGRSNVEFYSFNCVWFFHLIYLPLKIVTYIIQTLFNIIKYLILAIRTTYKVNCHYPFSTSILSKYWYIFTSFQLTVEEYVQSMELLVNDVRFSLYNVCYKRILVVWITIAFIVLLGLLFSGLSGLTLFGLGIGWLILNACAIFLSMYIKFKLQRNLEKCLANVNKQLLRHKIIIAVDDRGKISCHKVNLCFIYLDSAPCIAHLQTSIEQQERDPRLVGNKGWISQPMILSSKAAGQQDCHASRWGFFIMFK